MTFFIHKPRQAIGLLYIILYILILLVYLFFLNDDQSWLSESKFTAMVFLWFILSFAVKVSMVWNRVIELLNLLAVLAFMSISFTYNPKPAYASSIQDFCYYLYIIGGSACDFFDFLYQSGARRPEDTA
jgi:hypothetical protein